MKSSLLFSIFFVLLLSGSVLAKDVALVVKTSPNLNLIAQLDDLGYSYDTITQSEIISTNFSSYALLLIQEDVSNKAALPLNQKNAIFIVNVMSNSVAHIVWPGISIVSSQTLTSTLEQLNTPFTEGFNSLNFNAYTTAKPIYYLKIKPAHVSRIALTTGAGVPAGIAAYSQTPVKNVYFGFSSIDYWSASTKKLFQNSLKWARGDIDLDLDGFKIIDGDCNDQDAAINPNATEIPYNSIDEDCDGFDLTDVDGDGFDDILAGGTDCNDNNASINPNATESLGGTDLNCKPEAPVFIGQIPDLTWDEDSNLSGVNLNDYFQTYNSDPIQFFVYNTSEDLNIAITAENGLLTFSSTKDWNGQDWVVFGANSEGLINITNKIILTVLPINDAPIIQPIPNMTATEGDLINLNVNISDIDSQDLSLVFSSPLNSTGSWQTQLGEIGNYTIEATATDSENLSSSTFFTLTLLPDSQPPLITLLSPNNNSLIETDSLNLSFKATDDRSLILICNLFVLGDNLAVFELSSNETAELLLTNLNDSFYSWNIECSDSRLTISSETSYFEINVPQPPILQTIPDMIFEETENVTLSVIASDPENDTLTYSINDSRFIQSDNVFTWPTSYGDKGTYSFNVSVSDSLFITSQEIKITILKRNRAPVFLPIMLQQTDEDVSLVVPINASDPDNDSLTFSIIKETAEEVHCIINSSSVLLIPSKDWSGMASCTLQVSDSDLFSTLELAIKVLSVNDAPILNQPNNLTISEGEQARFSLTASDPDSSLSYSVNDSRFSKFGSNLFIWNTNYSDSGTYYVEAIASDGEFNSTQIIKITILDVNQAPYLFIQNLTIEEDSSPQPVNVSAFDNDGFVNEIKVSSSSSKVNCYLNQTQLFVLPSLNFNGSALCSITAYDDKDKPSAPYVFSITVLPINDAPEILSFSPTVNIVLPKFGKKIFSLSLRDIDSPISNLIVSWMMNNNLIGAGKDYTFQGNGSSGNFVLSSIVSDGEFNVSHSWNISIVSKPITTGFSGATTDFSNMSDLDLERVLLILEKENGKIEFLEPLNLSNTLDFPNYVTINKGLIAVDTDFLSALKHKKARLTFYNLTDSKQPSIYYTPSYERNPSKITQECFSGICSNISFDNETKSLSFYAPGFFSYKIGDIRSCSEQSGKICSATEICSGSLIDSAENNCCSGECISPPLQFKEIDQCLQSQLVELVIKDPDKNEKFLPGEIIPIELTLKNRALDQDFEITAYLYDTTSDEIIEETKEELTVDEDDQETIEFSLTVPNDFEADNDYVLVVRAEDSLCNLDYVSIKLDKEEHDVALTDIRTDNEIYSCGQFVNLEIQGQNLGSKSEPGVYLRAENPTLLIDAKTDSFDLSKKGSSSRFTKYLSFPLPKDAEPGLYVFDITTYFAGESIKTSKTIEVVRCTSLQQANLSSEEVYLQNTNNLVKPSIQQTSLPLNFFLIVGIGLVIILIIIFYFSRRR